MNGSASNGTMSVSRLISVMGLFFLLILFTPSIYGVTKGLAIAAASPNSIDLTWTAPGDDSVTGLATQYDLRYSTSTITEANWSSATQAVGEPTPHSAGTLETITVSNLNPSTTYYFAIKAADEVPNWSALSNVVTKATSAETSPPAAIANFAAGASTSTSVPLTWIAPGDDSVTGTASTYDIRYSTSTITLANWASATQATGEPAPKVAGSAESFTVTGLSPNTTYYFAIRTADEVPNWSGLSNVVNRATALESTPPAAIANLSTGVVTSTTVGLIWTAPGDDGSTGTASQYDIRYSTSGITEANWATANQVTGEPIPKSAGNAETFTVTGLQNGTTYYFAIKTADEVPNWSALSNVPQRATLDQIAPARINDLTAAPGGNVGEILLTWTATGDDGMLGTASSYVMRYSTSPIDDAAWQSDTPYPNIPAPFPAGTVQTASMSGLEPGKLYYVGLKVRDEFINESGLSNVASAVAQTDFVLDFDDEQVAIASPTPGSELQSSHPTLVVNNIGFGLSNQYHFEVAADSLFMNLVAVSPPVPQGEGPTTSWKVENRLSGGERYYWRARANDYAFSPLAYFSLNPLPHAYPNPFNPNRGDNVTFTDIPRGSDVVIVSVSGSPVREWSNVLGEELIWDGSNDAGYKVASGTYLWYVSGSNAKGKLVIVR